MPYQIAPVLALKDNYIWMIISPDKKFAVVVDPGEAKPVVDKLKHEKINLAGILVTHHHADHTNGISELVDKYKCPVYGPGLKNGEIYLDKLNLRLAVLEIPGHTLDQNAFYGLNSVFTGDTLFCAGCGKIFEGTPEQIFKSLQILAKLPDETKVYCGHEYTENNIKFARTVEPNNPNFDLQVKAPSTIKIEKLTNPFLRCHLPDIRASVEKHCGKTLSSPVEVFAELREWKNNY
ncbi:MAG: hydroxyacylglutathione hydrolase [Gammaproteobacteria bacterium]|nr:hydroxyacylglutathione hydrolase [Gammaproteobacteria bacterium]